MSGVVTYLAASPRAQTIDEASQARPAHLSAPLRGRSRPTGTTDPSWPFAAFKDHYGFSVISPKVMRAHAAEFKGYEVGKATIRFPASKPLPDALVTKLVKARIAENDRGWNE